ncbi:VQ motif-containing protein 4 isoform X2 [Glycine max]|uniref:VQ motif-containing protein 4 isoform X2 n=1 Tax=Glycine max TaxID=3847 RepID=UPI0007192068|nr:VQ motif-containing protein 4 isoform X2 [Glycine max]|eukprot:XP_014633613.1 VQ motif-containing protein 4 isoform X2 [Glycine max]
MDSPRYHQEHHHHRGGVSLVPSPRHSLSSSNSSSTSSTSSNNNGLHHTQLLSPLTPTAAAAQSPTSSYPPKPVTRSESANPYPTTFVQADTTSFKQVVQMLTGSTQTAKQASASASEPAKPHTHIPPIKKQTGFKLFERRNSLSKNLSINPLNNVVVSSFSPRKHHEVLSPSILDFPALVLSPVTPLIPDPFNRSRSLNENGAGMVMDTAEATEEKAIKEKGFFLHPSPASTPRDEKPRLLPLFPTTTTAAASPVGTSFSFESQGVE